MLIDLVGPGPLHQKIYQALKVRMLEGGLRPGTRVPSSRALARELCVSRNVVLIAYGNLLAEGYLECRHGSGTYVASALESYVRAQSASRSNKVAVRRASPRLSEYSRRLGMNLLDPLYQVSPQSVRYDFRYGHPAVDMLAHRVWRALISRHMARLAPSNMGYGPPEGHPELRDAVAAYLRDSRGVDCDSSQVIIVNGSQQALDLACRVLLDPGDSVALEEPCYPGMRQALIGIGAKIHPVSVDNEGLVTDGLSELPDRPRLICVTPSHQYPLGHVMSLTRRLALVEFARRTRAFVLEDDYDSEFRYGTRPEKSIQGLDRDGRVIYVSTFSKVLFPALRIGYLVLPKELVRPFVVAKSVTDRYTATFLQAVLADFITEGHFERHLRRMRREVGERRTALIETLNETFGKTIEISGESAGVHVLVKFPKLSRTELHLAVKRATTFGVAAYPVDSCFISPPRVPGLVIGYASMPIRHIREGVRSLARAFNQTDSARTSGTMLQL